MKKNKKLLLAGCFDILHPGHVKLMEWCRKKFPKHEIVVLVARDKSIRKIKKRNPVFSEEERKILLSSIKHVDRVIKGSEKDFLLPVIREKPDVIVLGHDQEVDEQKLEHALRSRGIEARILRAPAFKPEKWKSTHIRKKVVKGK